MLDASAYLDRIDYSGPTNPSAETLRALHRAHLLAVPFENLDIHRRPIICDEAAFLHKIINQRRGGFCYELNGAFAALLRSLGFQVTLLSARVGGADGNYGRAFAHLALRVALSPSHLSWLADVGFGDSFLEPLLLQPDLAQPQIGRVYRLTEEKNQSGGEIDRMFSMEVKAEDSPSQTRRDEQHEKWTRKYSFSLQPYHLADFASMCHYQQTSPDSHFTRQRICSRATPEGRITLSDLKLIQTRNGSRTERELAGDTEWRAVLLELFHINLPA